MDKMRTEWEETEFTFIDYRDTVSLIVGGGGSLVVSGVALTLGEGICLLYS